MTTHRTPNLQCPPTLTTRALPMGSVSGSRVTCRGCVQHDGVVCHVFRLLVACRGHMSQVLVACRVSHVGVARHVSGSRVPCWGQVSRLGHVSCVTCPGHISRVWIACSMLGSHVTSLRRMLHVSVACPVSHVTCHMLHVACRGPHRARPGGS